VRTHGPAEPGALSVVSRVAEAGSAGRERPGGLGVRRL
jgi:hypothetical protein